MHQVFEFIGNHPALVGIFVFLILALIIAEVRAQLTGAKKLSPQQTVMLMNREQAVVLDIRDEAAFQRGHIAEAVHCPGKLDTYLDKITTYRERPIVIVCERGMKAAQIALQLKQQGFTQVNVLSGGLAAWREAKLPITKD